MIPFPRIISYGNILPKTKIKKVVSYYGFVFVLYDDGQAFGTGDNTSGQLGDGTLVNKNTWVKCPIENIKDIYVGVDCTLIITENNKVFFTGYRASLGASSGYLNTFTDITSTFNNFDLNKAKLMFGSRGLFLLQDEQLYAIGQGTYASNNIYGNVGLGATSSSSFKRVASGVKEIYSSLSSSSDASFYISTTGELFGTGRNLYGTLGLGFASEQPTFYKVPFTLPIKTINLSSMNVLITTENNEVYMSGNRSNGLCADGSSASAYYTTLTKNTLIDSELASKFVQYTNSFCSEGAIYLCTSESIYSSGSDYYGRFGIGNTSTIIYSTLVQNGFLQDIIFDPTHVVQGGYYVYYWHENTVYAVGNSRWIPGSTEDFTKWNKVPMQPRII
ncbi:hypothetical protein BZF66_05760 [Salmonella enterica]|uniref:hypothetical protein n=1 Tax=Salmonella enterica TaxID=28901 RepID=UPI00137E9742|nr:hypothetical protein [Salmonella enterica]ECV9083933.1 hypothetical protein [Salmonella enterica subsp. enterica serovar Infantis]EME3782968.1 hypothetical protein [Salmonella enterica]